MSEMFWKGLSISLIFIIVVNLALKYIYRKKNSSNKKKKRVQIDCPKEEVALNIIVRSDLKMKDGKIISQVSHALTGVILYLTENPGLLKVWRNSGEAKIVMKANSEEIKDITEKAKNMGVFVYKVYDAGRTQVPTGSNTVITLGPAPRSKLKLITGHLKLF